MEAAGEESPWQPPKDATPEQLAEFEAFQAKMLVPDELVTTWIELDDETLRKKWDAIHEHVTQISDESPFMLLGFEGWQEGWANEAYILRESRVDAPIPETDLFAGIV
jgi:mycothiol S-conjugate amidase